MTQTVVIVALALFAMLMAGIGIYSARQSKTIDGFLLGGRKIGGWMSAFAYGTTYFSAVIFIGYAGKNGWDVGFPSLWIGAGNAVLGSLLAWKLLARPTRRMTKVLDARTMPEFFEGRYLSSGMKIFSALVIFIFLVPYAASVYKGLGALFGVLLPDISNAFGGISADTLCMFFVAVLAAFYLMLGGYKATVLTDFIQGIIMIIGVVIMVVALVANPQVGGLTKLFERLRDWPGTGGRLVSIFGGDMWNFLMFNILLTSLGTWGLPQMVTKFYAIKDERSIRRATTVSTAFALIIGCGAYFVGTMGRFFVESDASGAPVGGFDAVVPTMLMRAFGESIWGNMLLAVILLLVLSASMSTLSSIVLTSSSAVSVDLIQYLRPGIGKKAQVLLTRILCILFVALSFIFANFNFAIIMSIMAYSWGVVSGCFIGPFVWGLFKKGITRTGAWAGMLGGLCTVVVMTTVTMLTSPALSDGVYAAFKAASASSPTFAVTAMGVSLILTPVVSLFTKKLDGAHVKKLFDKTEAV